MSSSAEGMERLMSCRALCLFTSIVIASMSACGTMTGKEGYPSSSWGPLDPARTAEGCPELSGTYSNLGNAIFPPELGAPPTLSDVFARMAQAGDPLTHVNHSRDWGVPRDAKVVIIDQTADTLTVSFVDNQDTSHMLHFRKYHFDLFEERYDDLFTCYSEAESARLRFFAELGRTVAVLPLYVGAEAALVFLLRGADGSLVVQLRTEALGLSVLGVGSQFSFSSIWYRYPSAAR